MELVRDNSGKVIAVLDDLGVRWEWSPERLHVVGTREIDPNSGYYCEPYNVSEALRILRDGGYIE